MSMIINGKIMVVKNKGESMQSDVYLNELAAVCAMIDNGSLGVGGNTFYGSDAHKQALDEVEKQIAETRQSIIDQDNEINEQLEN